MWNTHVHVQICKVKSISDVILKHVRRCLDNELRRQPSYLSFPISRPSFEHLLKQFSRYLTKKFKMPKVSKAITPEKFDGICSNVNQAIYLLIIPYQRSKFQDPS